MNQFYAALTVSFFLGRGSPVVLVKFYRVRSTTEGSIKSSAEDKHRKKWIKRMNWVNFMIIIRLEEVKFITIKSAYYSTTFISK